MGMEEGADVFFRSGVTVEDVNGDGNVPVERERLTILQMVGGIEEDMRLSRLVGIGSQEEILHSVIF